MSARDNRPWPPMKPPMGADESHRVGSGWESAVVVDALSTKKLDVDPATIQRCCPAGALRAHPDTEEAATATIAARLVNTFAPVPPHRVVWYSLPAWHDGNRGRCTLLDDGALVVALRVGLGPELARTAVHEYANAATVAVARDGEAEWEEAAEDLTRRVMKTWQ